MLYEVITHRSVFTRTNRNSRTNHDFAVGLTMKDKSTMPTKDPAFWAALLIWLHDNWPSIYGFFLAVGIAWLRITYLGGRGQRRIIEASLCGLLTIAFSNGMEFFFGIPRELSGFVRNNFV